MAEYIEREAIIDWFKPYSHLDESISYETLLDDLRDFPTADVVKVKHGVWIQGRHRGGYACCSECGREISWMPEKCLFCPTCGTKMDKDEIS